MREPPDCTGDWKLAFVGQWTQNRQFGIVASPFLGVSQDALVLLLRLNKSWHDGISAGNLYKVASGPT